MSKLLTICASVVLSLSLSTAVVAGKTHTTQVIGNMDGKSVAHAVKTVKEARSGDTVKIRINSPGGYVYALVQLAYAIEQSDARVVAVMHNGDHAFSAAAVLLVHIEERELAPLAWIMFHMPYTFNKEGCDTVGVNGCEKVHDYTHPASKMAYDLIKHYVVKAQGLCILTQEEVDRVLNLEDVFVSTYTATDRMEDCL